MTLRNVPKAHTLEQQRQEINLIASDLNTAIDGVQTFGGNKEFTGDITFSGSGGASFGDNSDLKIYYDGSVGIETSFIDSDALQIRSATDTSELYATFLKDGPVELYYDGTKRFGTNSTGATVLGDLSVSSNLTFDNAGSHIEFTPSSWSGSAPYMEFWVGNNSGSHYAQIDGGNAGQLQIMNIGHPNGHLDLRTAKDFSVDCGGYYAILAQATGATKIWHPVSQEDILSPKFETTATGAKVNGFFESSLLVNTNNTPTTGEGIEMMYDSAASGGAAGTIQAYDRDGSALTRLRIKSTNWEILNNGSATFAGGDFEINETGNANGKVNIDSTSDGGNSAWGLYVKNNDSRAGRPALKLQNVGDANAIEILNADGTAVTTTITSGGSATFAGQLGVNQTSINASRQMEITQPAGFTSGLRINSNGNAGDGAYYEVFVGSANYKFGGDHSTNALLFKKDGTEYMRHTSSGGIQLNNPNGDTSLSIGDPTNSEGRLILTSKLNTVEIHSRSNHPIEFLFNTTSKATLGINGDLSLDGGLTFSSQPNSSVGNNVTETSSSFSHYEQGTFSPYYAFGLTSPSYNFTGGDYIRIGNVVHFYITISATGTNNGDAVAILGLPYNPAGTDGGSATFSYNTGLVSNGATMPNIYLDPNGQIRFYEGGSGSAWAGNSGSGLSGAALYIGGHYRCA